MAVNQYQQISLKLALQIHKNLANVNEVKALFLNPRSDIQILFGVQTRDYITAKFMYGQIKVSQTTYHWSGKTKAGNFKLALSSHKLTKKGKFHSIGYASKQLIKHEKNYSPFLLEMVARVWAMEYYQKHLRSRRFIYCT
jgi:hypothetical protein